MRIHPKDVVSYAGRDYIVEGTATYHLGGKSFVLARAVDGEIVFWIEALRDESDDRLLVLREVRDLEIAVPPPESISYHDLTYVQRLSGRATVEVAGRRPRARRGQHRPLALPRRRRPVLPDRGRRRPRVHAGGRVGPSRDDRRIAGALSTDKQDARQQLRRRCSASPRSASRTAPASASSSTAARPASRWRSRRSSASSIAAAPARARSRRSAARPTRSRSCRGCTKG